MQSQKFVFAAALAFLFAAALPAAAQADVIVGALTGPQNYDPDSSGRSALAIGTDSCNIGTIPLLWFANTNQHPVIGQNVYRVKDGVFEMIGVSWLKHGFTALQNNLCSPCTPFPNGTQLGVGCSDPYSAGLNGQQGGLGPRYQVNPSTGAFPYPYANPSRTGNARRVLIDSAELNPALNAGARYFGEGQYIAPDDAAAGNGENNASWREMAVTGPRGVGFNMGFTGPTVRTEPAIMAWPTVDRFAQVVNQDVPNDGRIFLGFNAIPLGGSWYRYVYAIHNLNSDRAVRAIEVQMPTGFSSRNFEFRNVDWHSGETWLATPWTSSTTANSVAFTSPHTFASNANGSAVRWGSTFTVIFEADRDPQTVALEMFKPGVPATINFPAFTVFRPGWATNSTEASFAIDNGTNDPFLGPIETDVTFGQTSTAAISGTAGGLYDVFLSAAPGLLNGLVAPGGTIINLDLTQPVTPFFGTFQSMPASGTSFSLVAPTLPIALSAQLVNINAASADGFSTSAMTDYEVALGAAPTISSISPIAAAVGQTVVITGTGFRSVAAVTVGGTPAAVSALSSTSISFVVPAGIACDATVVVNNPDNQSTSISFNASPSVTGILLPQGSPAAGNVIGVVQGSGFATGTTVTVGGNPASILSLSGTVIAFRLPAGTAGQTAAVVVTTPAGCTGTSSITYQ